MRQACCVEPFSIVGRTQNQDIFYQKDKEDGALAGGHSPSQAEVHHLRVLLSCKHTGGEPLGRKNLQIVDSRTQSGLFVLNSQVQALKVVGQQRTNVGASPVATTSRRCQRVKQVRKAHLEEVL
jgi:hypothetical protein